MSTHRGSTVVRDEVVRDEARPSPGTDHVQLDISGMTCASCASRVEKKLNKLDGVQATVNYATERADVRFPAGRGIDVATLVDTVERTGYGASQTRHESPDGPENEQAAAYLRRLRVAAVLSIPVIILGMVPPLQFPGWQWVSFVLVIPVVTWCAYPFHKRAWTNLRHGATNMDTLISLGVSAAFLWSTYALFLGGAGEIGMRHHLTLTLDRHNADMAVYFEAAAAIVTFLLAGRWMEARAKHASGAALRALFDLGAKEVTLLRDGVEHRVPIEQLHVGDVFVVRPGEKVATDGVVTEGTSAIDASLLTGESVPVDVAPGDAVVGATINSNGRLVVRATKVGSETQLSRIATLVEDAQVGKAPVQRLADRISGVFVPIVLVLALATLVIWLASGAGASIAIGAAVSVLIIACPCALGLATPTALLVGSGRGAQLGILIRGLDALERARTIDTIVLDKTGTITEGRMSLSEVVPAGSHTEAEVVSWAGAAESGSEHPIARAIAEARPDGDHRRVRDVAGLPGSGVRAFVEDRTVLVGRPALLAEHGIDVPTDLDRALQEAQARGETAVLVAVDGEAYGMVGVSDTIRPTSAEAISRLADLGLRPVLLTGDNERAARQVAEQVGVDEVIADVMPQDKVDVVSRLRAEGRSVAMVGDGVNDAAALTGADLGISMGTGTDVAMEASDLTLVRGDLVAAVDAIRLSRATLRTIRGNLFWAFAYNVAMIPLAALGFLNPMVAGAAMAFSSVFVVTNSLRLRGFDRAAH